MRNVDDTEHAAIRAVAAELIRGGWSAETAFAYATRGVLGGGSRRLVQKFDNGNRPNLRGRRTPAGGAWSGATKELTAWNYPVRGRKQEVANRKADAARIAAGNARRKLKGIGTDQQREAHILVRVQGLRQAEAARRHDINLSG